MARQRDRLSLKFFQFVEGEAEGRFAILALVFVILASLVLFAFSA